MDTGIYQIRNLNNGHFYIGSAASFLNRRRQHRHDLRQGKHGNSILQKAWNKHGEKAFVFEKLIACSKDNMLMYEQRALDAMLPYYNICRNARNSLGVKRTDEAKAKIGAAGKGRPASAYQRLRASETHRGRPKTAEQIAKMSVAALGRRCSVETRAKLSAIKKARTHCIRGHELSGENLYIPPKRPDSRYCRACAVIRNRRA